jgi:hypothetical protein
MMEAVDISETFVRLYETTQRNIPKYILAVMRTWKLPVLPLFHFVTCNPHVTLFSILSLCGLFRHYFYLWLFSVHFTVVIFIIVYYTSVTVPIFMIIIILTTTQPFLTTRIICMFLFLKLFCTFAIYSQLFRVSVPVRVSIKTLYTFLITLILGTCSAYFILSVNKEDCKLRICFNVYAAPLHCIFISIRCWISWCSCRWGETVFELRPPTGLLFNPRWCW